jgi:hypothetical protein
VVYVYFLGKGIKHCYFNNYLFFLIIYISEQKMWKKVLHIAKHLKVMKMEK